MASDVERGDARHDVAFTYDVCLATVDKACAEFGLQPPNKQAIRRKKIATAVARGMSCKYAAKRFGVHISTVANACRIHEVTVGRRTTIPSMRSFEILLRLLNGEDQCKIADSFGISRQRVGQIAFAARSAGFSIAGRSTNKTIPMPHLPSNTRRRSASGG